MTQTMNEALCNDRPSARQAMKSHSWAIVLTYLPAYRQLISPQSHEQRGAIRRGEADSR